MFLRKANVIKRISEVRESPHPDVLSSLFSDAIVTMGLEALRDPVDERRVPPIDGPERFGSLLNTLGELYPVPSSLLKLQVSEIHLTSTQERHVAGIIHRVD